VGSKHQSGLIRRKNGHSKIAIYQQMMVPAHE
jgi:hypothetical protein